MSDRVVKKVPPPAREKLKSSQIFDKSGKVNTELLKNHFFSEGRLEVDAAIKILEQSRKILKSESTLLEISSPITICGDIHGQFYDLLTLFEVSGNPPDSAYLFLGDYVDRGSFSSECLLYLLTFKINFPNSFFLLRGNHESRLLTEYFSFKKECLVKYNSKFYESCMSTFECLPLAALVDKRYFCVHGGISPEMFSIAHVQKINRFREPPPHGLFCDLLWSDPHPNYDSSKKSEYFTYNPVRGCANYYSYPAVCDFLKTNGLLTLIRAHEVQNDGFRLYKKTTQNFPSIVTVFSAPNYCDVYRNKGAILLCTSIQLSFRQYSCKPHPYWLPDFEDAFSWSIPYMADSLTGMLVSILNVCSEEELEGGNIVKKIDSIKSLSTAYSEMTDKRNYMIKLSGVSPPSHVSWKEVESKRSSLTTVEETSENFEKFKALDQINEIIPSHNRKTRKTIPDKLRSLFS